MKTDINPLKKKRDDPSDLTQTTFCFDMLPPEILRLITSYLSPNANADLFQTLRSLHVVPTESDTNRTSMSCLQSFPAKKRRQSALGFLKRVTSNIQWLGTPNIRCPSDAT